MGKTVNKGKKHLGKIIIDEDFILFRPNKQYRVNSNIILIKTGNNPLLFEVGKHNNPPIDLILKMLKKQKIPKSSIKYLIISHGHQDHMSNLLQVQGIFPQIKTICHKSDLKLIKYPFIFPKSWKNTFRLYGFSDFSFSMFNLAYKILVNFYVGSLQLPNQIDYTVNKESTLKIDSDRIKIIPTPGHSKGHLSLLDSNKNLYLADFVPNTPWISPTKNSLNFMISSIKRILKFSSNQVKRTIRSHGDMRIKNHLHWEISPWNEEKERFKIFLEKIYSTLDLIPSKIKNRTVDIDGLTALFNKDFYKYDAFMRKFFIPPAFTWSIVYANKLEGENKIQLIKRGGKYFWTS